MSAPLLPLPKTSMNPKVDQFLSETPEWREETKRLRAIALRCGLTEELKWGKPCYSFQESNVVILQGFKESCALLFCKGALLKDPKGLLERPGENTQAARRIRFTHVREIVKLEPTLHAYILEAIAAEKPAWRWSLRRVRNLFPRSFRKNWMKAPP